MYFFLHIFVYKNLFIKKIKRLEISLITSFILLLISWKDEIPILFLDFTISRSEGNKPWYLLMSSSVYTLKYLSPTESSGMKSDTQEITLFGWKAIASSISFLTVGLSDITYKYFSCSKLNDSRTFSKDA